MIPSSAPVAQMLRLTPIPASAAPPITASARSDRSVPNLSRASATSSAPPTAPTPVAPSSSPNTPALPWSRSFATSGASAADDALTAPNAKARASTVRIGVACQA